MRSTMIRFTVVLLTAFVAGTVASGTAHADEDDLPEQVWLVCPPSCDPPEEPDPELNCPPICEDIFPGDLAIDDPCPPDLCGPFPPGDPDEDEQEPADEPTDQPTDEPNQDGGDAGSAGESATGSPTAESQDSTSAEAEVAPIAEIVEQPSAETSDGSSNAALLVIFASAGLAATGVLAYAVTRRR